MNSFFEEVHQKKCEALLSKISAASFYLWNWQTRLHFTTCYDSITVFPHIVSSLELFPHLVKKLYEIFKLLWIQKRIVLRQLYKEIRYITLNLWGVYANQSTDFLVFTTHLTSVTTTFQFSRLWLSLSKAGETCDARPYITNIKIFGEYMQIKMQIFHSGLG